MSDDTIPHRTPAAHDAAAAHGTRAAHGAGEAHGTRGAHGAGEAHGIRGAHDAGAACGTPAARDTRGARDGAARLPADDEVLGSAETLMTRFTAQLTVQLAHLRPFPEPVASPAPAARRVPAPERA